jgi:hypothetical protein
MNPLERLNKEIKRLTSRNPAAARRSLAVRYY